MKDFVVDGNIHLCHCETWVNQTDCPKNMMYSALANLPNTSLVYQPHLLILVGSGSLLVANHFSAIVRTDQSQATYDLQRCVFCWPCHIQTLLTVITSLLPTGCVVFCVMSIILLYVGKFHPLNWMQSMRFNQTNIFV